MKHVVKMNRLYDFYGGLLSSNQNEAFTLYYIDDLSLSEISDITGITRQGVYDSIKRAEKRLEEYEEKLGLIARFDRNKEVLLMIKKILKNKESITVDNINKISVLVDGLIDDDEVIDNGI